MGWVWPSPPHLFLVFCYADMESIAQVRIETHSCLVMLKPLHQVPSRHPFKLWLSERERDSFVSAECSDLCCSSLHVGVKWGTGLETPASQPVQWIWGATEMQWHSKGYCNLFEREFAFSNRILRGISHWSNQKNRTSFCFHPSESWSLSSSFDCRHLEMGPSQRRIHHNHKMILFCKVIVMHFIALKWNFWNNTEFLSSFAIWTYLETY